MCSAHVPSCMEVAACRTPLSGTVTNQTQYSGSCILWWRQIQWFYHLSRTEMSYVHQPNIVPCNNRFSPVLCGRCQPQLIELNWCSEVDPSFSRVWHYLPGTMEGSCTQSLHLQRSPKSQKISKLLQESELWFRSGVNISPAPEFTATQPDVAVVFYACWEVSSCRVEDLGATEIFLQLPLLSYDWVGTPWNPSCASTDAEVKCKCG